MFVSFFKILLLWKGTGFETLELNNSKGGFVDKLMGLNGSDVNMLKRSYSLLMFSGHV